MKGGVSWRDLTCEPDSPPARLWAWGEYHIMHGAIGMYYEDKICHWRAVTVLPCMHALI